MKHTNTTKTLYLNVSASVEEHGGTTWRSPSSRPMQRGSPRLVSRIWIGSGLKKRLFFINFFEREGDRQKREESLQRRGENDRSVLWPHRPTLNHPVRTRETDQ